MSNDVAQSEQIIFAYLPDGYSFRNVIHYLKQTVTKASFVFDERKIKLEKENNDNTVLNKLKINAKADLMKYEYNVINADGQKEPCIAVGFETAEMFKIAKLIGKKDGVCLSIIAGEPHIKINIINYNDNGTGGAPPVNVVPMIDIETVGFTKIEYMRKAEDPNVKIGAAQFSKACRCFTALRCKEVTAIGYNNGVIFKGIGDDGAIRRLEPFGDTSNNNPIDPALASLLSTLNFSQKANPSPSKPKLKIVENPNLVSVKIGVIKAMTKFGNLTASGTVKIYMEHKKPMKIVIPVGSYGKLTIYIRNVPDDSVE